MLPVMIETGYQHKKAPISGEIGAGFAPGGRGRLWGGELMPGAPHKGCRGRYLQLRLKPIEGKSG